MFATEKHIEFHIWQCTDPLKMYMIWVPCAYCAIFLVEVYTRTVEMSYWPYHQGYFILPQAPLQPQAPYQDMRSPISENEPETVPDYIYYVKFINPKKKSDFLV